jgi:hypothetical protein
MRLKDSRGECKQTFNLKVKGRFFLLIGIRDESSEQVDQKIEDAAMAGMLNLSDVFELVID